ncbi:hypothetical protein BV22DRAFT_423143 [Leucogyrophana mollusca]|uniref:Uncharacterized protein n=1 Tax=Leucogyrophana mollusca TaxID=85980 RepID=A0ACB8BIK7_9AGAM|nr:hypothetical protein BV22DRAFT_423143 [Leucogyrophana mollusca]
MVKSTREDEWLISTPRLVFPVSMPATLLPIHSRRAPIPSNKNKGLILSSTQLEVEFPRPFQTAASPLLQKAYRRLTISRQTPTCTKLTALPTQKLFSPRAPTLASRTLACTGSGMSNVGVSVGPYTTTIFRNIWLRSWGVNPDGSSGAKVICCVTWQSFNHHLGQH